MTQTSYRKPMVSTALFSAIQHLHNDVLLENVNGGHFLRFPASQILESRRKTGQGR
jgi:hypothetical protein